MLATDPNSSAPWSSCQTAVAATATPAFTSSSSFPLSSQSSPSSSSSSCSWVPDVLALFGSRSTLI